MTKSLEHGLDLEPVAKNLRAVALDVAWRQWRALGAQATSQRRSNSIVDPEALILISLTLMDEEVRLADLVNDWMALNSNLLSVQRMRNLCAAYPATTRERLCGLARVALERGKDSRWRPLMGQTSAVHPSMSPSHGRHIEGIRPRSNKMRAIRPKFTDPSTLMLQLRLGLGVGAKADVLTYLLATKGGRAVREIASASSYTAAAVRRAAEDMAAARLIQANSGQPVAYRTDKTAWTKILGLTDDLPDWRSWHDRFLFVVAFLSYVQMAKLETSHYAAGVKARELMEKHRSAFEQDLVAAWSEHTTVPDWLEFLTTAVRALANWMVDRA
jgi:hypothetical protein